ncbi:hypothetical protein G6F46_011182 [Rhizopus delemar]|nr:hypothetical protein G6F55_010847 [Rhizopus delemar]KAG1536295.1 hypothetical protein G6F51_011049 [Rhizopus arrhizus]KAG1522274.1 hypothetical protein G6F52_006005 [Rhizopus delemar]KAG1543258.1 hypothetical protein G6F49_011396 [Rhizopus delemar]KAG1564622.1 hypothetical protein G6F50_010845 [Rhizopus delemar]
MFEDGTKESKAWGFYLRTHHTVREIVELVGLNRYTVQGIKTKIDNYNSPLPHKQTDRPLKVNERTERHLNRIIREDPFASYKEIKMELAKLDVFVSIKIPCSYVDRLDFKSYRATHKPRLTGGGGSGAMVWGCFWGGGFGPLEIIETCSVDQKDMHHYFDQQVSSLVYKCHVASEMGFYLPRGWCARAMQLLNEMKKNKRKANKDESIITFNNQGPAFNNNVIINGDVIVENGVKKQKFNHVEDANSWQVENEEDFWDVWRQFMDCCCCHDFCPEKYHIIECGYSIQCKPNVPQQLYDRLNVNAAIIKNPFKQHAKYSFAVLDTLKNLLEKWKEARKAVVADDNDNGDEDVEVKGFLQDINSLKKKDVAVVLSQCESNYDLFVLWSMMSLAAGELDFVAGEYVLHSSKEEYKADACILDSSKNEICLLETSGCYLLGGLPKYGYDHVKGAFGALTMFNAAFKKYHRASFKVAQQLNILFVHTHPKTPTNSSSSSHVVALGKLFWCLKMMLEKAVCVLKSMKESHNQNELKMMMGEEALSNLLEYVDTEIQKPIKGAGYGILLPKEKEEQEVFVTYV